MGGSVLFDDSSDRHVDKVIKFIWSNDRETFEEVDLSQHVGERGPRLRRRIAKADGRVQFTCYRRMSVGNTSLDFRSF